MDIDQAQGREQVIDEQSRGEKLALGVFALLEPPMGLQDAIPRMERMVQSFSGCEAVAIQLKDEEAFPCFREKGLADPQCICTHIMRGLTGPDVPYFSASGSFWINDRSLLDSASLGSRIVCLPPDRSDGCESMAIVPLRCGNRVIGLLQLKDSARDRLSETMIQALEMVANAIGIVLERIQSGEQQIRVREDLEARLHQRTAQLGATNELLQTEAGDRATLEQHLLLSQQRLELAMHAANLGSWDWDVSSSEVFFDRLWSSFAGYTGDEGESSFCTWNNLVHPDDKLRVLRALKNHLDDPSRPYEAEYRLQAKTGEWRWILDRGQVVQTDEASKPLRMAGIYFDITERKHIEEQLHDNAERLRVIFESARDCIFIKNASLRYTHVNPHFATILGREVSDIEGQTDEALFGKSAAAILRETDLRVLDGETLEQEHSRKVKGGSATFLDIKVPMRNSSGQVVGIIGISREITSRMRTQSEKKMLEPHYDSPTFMHTLHAARKAAQTDSIILLTGESGSGKDYLARYIHRHSKRSGGPFFFINCAAVAPDLAESELFGHEPGAFTSARGIKLGLLELAEGGTILLNEIGELSLALQAKLLTFLDTRQFNRVGGTRLRSVNARLIAATNRDLAKEVQAKRFRHDLFYRLDVFAIEVPPLRKRVEDIPDLAGQIIRDLGENLGLDAIPVVDEEAMKALTEYHWPGNVRELRNVLERALILCDKVRITTDDLYVHGRLNHGDAHKEWSFSVAFPQGENLNDVTYEVKRRLVVEALRRTNGTRSRAARLLGISIDSLKHYMRVYGLYG